METATPRNLFRYPLWLTPEASFIVRRNEPAYTILIPLWLKARSLLPEDAVAHGILPSDTQLAVALVCEMPPEFKFYWKQGLHDITKNEISCCALSLDFPGAEEAMPALSAFIMTLPHLRYVEMGGWDDVLDAETIAFLRKKDNASV